MRERKNGVSRRGSSVLFTLLGSALLVAAQAPVAGAVTASGGGESWGDTVQTPYGELGKWMLTCQTPKSPDCQPSDWGISDWLGQQQPDGRRLDEPINVVIVDRTSTSPEEATLKLLGGMAAAGFPSKYGHSDGYRAMIGSALQGQQPTRVTCNATVSSKYGCAFADQEYNHLGPIDHARAFGPAPLPDGHGYVWIEALSTERPGLYHFRPTHLYKSFKTAQDNLCTGMSHVAGVRIGDPIDLQNRLDGIDRYTGDYTGKACLAFLP
ncbi:hypothetical protein ACFQ6N_38100 [Kitasatospora sp. NPDC056446]|uniref:hypothetical protein n=1 Tax=Kitasatospora sp. NPDC056446 TaxID=3345819 RepID=UPI0036C02676